VWNDAVEQTFNALKEAMYTTIVLAVTNFTNNFVLEHDASGKCI
jgi:hypothetical protein